MSDPEAMKEFPDEKQRLAVANQKYRMQASVIQAAIIVTSTDAHHYHTAEIDEKGNGKTISTLPETHSNHIHQIANNIIQTSREEGMLSLDKSLAELVKTGEILLEDALAHAHDQQSLKAMTRR